MTGNGSSKKTYSVKKIFPHKGFDFKSAHDDIGLVQLNDTIKFNDKVNLIKLPLEKDLDKANYQAVATGWGKLLVKKYFEKCDRHLIQIHFQISGETSDKLHEINLTVIDHDKCKKERSGSFPITDNQICTFTTRGEGMCTVS